MSNMTNQFYKFMSKVSKIFTRDERGQSATPAFDFIGLPLEIQDLILLKVAVERRLASETFGEVHEALAVVCKRWLELMTADHFYERVKRRTFLRDPMCRYLRNVQSISVIGLAPTDFLTCAVTLDDKMYISTKEDDTDQIVVYDLDESAVRHEEKEKRKLICCNRRPLALNLTNGMNIVGLIVPCPRTHTLYVHVFDALEEHASILQVHVNDGTLVRYWDLEMPVPINLSLSSSGSYMIITRDEWISVYDTSSGSLVKTQYLTDENVQKQELFFYATLSNESLENLVVVTSTPFLWKSLLALDDHHCRLELNNGAQVMLYDNCSDRSRELRLKQPIASTIYANSLWYDCGRGLVFCPNGKQLEVLRVTY